jgi:hypothetical protein
VGGRGILLAGPTHAGKTTTALHLARRGHGLLGDEAALLRLATGDLLPMRRAVTVRPGPHGAIFAAHAPGGRGVARPISALFPGSWPEPAPLRAAFFLTGFADRPSRAPFRLTLTDETIFDALTSVDIAYAAWGTAPERRALRLLALRQALGRVPGWRLEVGPPSETAELIERTVEELRC